ncbi:hypothetical protein JCM10212_000487 [Sporobolomyces blumeae]
MQLDDNLVHSEEGTYETEPGVSLSYVVSGPLSPRTGAAPPLRPQENDSRPPRTTTRLALIAHPWSRLGGSKRDHVVVALESVLVSEGYSVVRYDSRGAGESQGVPTWTGDSERQDFEVILHKIVLPLASIDLDCPRNGTDDTSTTSPSIDLVLCGYSFGALVASACPPPPPPRSSPRQAIRTRYLLLSYPLSVLWALTAFRTGPFTLALRDRVSTDRRRVCIAYGTRDQFSSCAKLDAWATALVASAASEDGHGTVDVVRVDGADHFWAKASQKRELVDRVAEWVRT